MPRIALGLAAVLTLVATPAIAAECLPEQEQLTGMALSGAAKAAASAVIPVEGKQMVNLQSCEARGPKVVAEFRYNFMAAGGYYWLEGEVTVDKAGAAVVKAKKLSDNLAALDKSKGNVLLASR